MKKTTCPACEGIYEGHGCVCGSCHAGPPGRPFLCPLCRALLCYDFDLSPRRLTEAEAALYPPDYILQMLEMKQALEQIAATGADMARVWTRMRATHQGRAIRAWAERD